MRPYAIAEAATRPSGANFLRAYPPDSPRARARLIVMALLADGRLDDAELESLGRDGAFAKLGIERDEFFQVLYDFCADLSQFSVGEGAYEIRRESIARLLNEIRSPAQQQQTLQLILDVIRSDGHLDDAEAQFLWQAVDAWNLRLDGGGPIATRRRRRREYAAPAS